MTEVKWGDPIAVDGKRPEWLRDDPIILWATSRASGACPADQLSWRGSGGYTQPVETIRLVADHPYYTATAQGFTYWPGGDKAPDDWDGGEVLMSDPVGVMLPERLEHHWPGTSKTYRPIIGYRREGEPDATFPADWALTEARGRAPGLGAESNMEWVMYTTSPGAVLMIELARMIEKYEPHLAPVDLDVLEVRKIMAAIADANGSPSSAASWSSGALDDEAVFQAALTAYRQGKSS